MEVKKALGKGGRADAMSCSGDVLGNRLSFRAIQTPSHPKNLVRKFTMCKGSTPFVDGAYSE